jgi:AsmA family protein
MSRSLRRTLRWIGIGLAGLILLLVLFLAFFDLNLLKHPIERIATSHVGRQVVIAGRLEGHLLSWTPQVTVNGLQVANPPGEEPPHMLAIDRLLIRVRLLPLLHGAVVIERLELTHPVVDLHRDVHGHANWTFENQRPSNAPAGPPARLPVVRTLIVDSGQLSVQDAILHLDAQAKLQAHEQASADDPHAFRLEAKGTLNRQPLALSAFGGPLLSVDAARPYPFALQITAGDIHIESDGIVRKPFDMGTIALTIRATGGDLADFYYLTQLAFPNTPPFTLRASIERDDNVVHVNSLAGQVGGSDLHGKLDVDLSHKRPMVSGDLISKQLRMQDLAASLGSKAAGSVSDTSGHSLSTQEKHRATRKPRAPPATVPANARLLPDARLQVERVRAMNADVRFTATSIEAGAVPMKQVLLHIRLQDGVLSLDPVEFTMPQGTLHGTVRIDARGSVPATQLDLRVSNIELAQLKDKAPDASAPLSGDLQARIVAAGKGDSVHDFAADANGRVTVVLPHGEVREAFAELTGIDVVRGLGLLLAGPDQRTAIRCGVAQFALQDGTMHVQNLVFDMQNVLVTGTGEIRLGPEELDLTVTGEPKKLRFGRLHTPIKVGGHLLKPSVGVSATKTLTQGAIATALGVLITPLAAVIAFVDPGLAKDADCAALLAEAGNAQAAPAAQQRRGENAPAAPPEKPR